jgi:hypothetical protein
MSLSAQQKLVSEAYRTVFAGRDGAIVLDDLLTFIRSAPVPREVTALELHAHIMQRCSLQRRAQLLAVEATTPPRRARIANLEE